MSSTVRASWLNPAAGECNDAACTSMEEEALLFLVLGDPPPVVVVDRSTPFPLPGHQLPA
ncbi:hypothetical protein PF003_g1059 [Phytophthora fragariae]|nr:hypothetical protein PF003_g1059 [Phytophthora fragariae]